MWDEKQTDRKNFKAGYSDFSSFKIICIIKYRYVLVIQKKYYEKLFLHIKGYI